jgi:mono/diheme cytochrome c family protein
MKKNRTKRLNQSLLAVSIATLLSSGVAMAKSDNMHQLYEDNCSSCHGSDHGGYLAPALNAETLKGRSPTALRTIVMAGSFDTLMPPFYGKLSDDEIRGVIKHLQATPKQPNPAWTMDDMKKSLKVYVKDEASLPDKPTYNSVTHQKVGEIPTEVAAHIIDFNPANPRWAYVKTDTAEIFKVDLYSMQATRSIKTGYNGPGMGVSRDGGLLCAAQCSDSGCRHPGTVENL